MHISPRLAGAAIFLLLLCQTAAAAGEQVVVRVEVVPGAAGTLDFEGTPAGRVQVPANGRATLQATVAPGSHASRLVSVDPALSGYRLVSIRCDDASSASASDGDLAGQEARFAVDPGETVACVFRLKPATACTCPRQGRWVMNNHPGRLSCAGPMAMAFPLPASTQTATLTPNGDCSALHAEGMTDDEADIEMHRQADCSWVGSVGGAQGPIPMQIEFSWTVGNEGRSIEGRLSSDMVQQGTTCQARRTFSGEFSGG